MTNELSKIMNFHLHVTEVKSSPKWVGLDLTNETTDSIASRLINGQVDMAIGSFFIMKEYLEYVDMSVPIDVACTSFLTPNPLRRPRFLALILPFQYQLWIMVLFICFVFAPLGFHFLAKLKPSEEEYRIFTAPTNVILTSFSIMSQVSLYVWPRQWPFRIIIGLYWIFCLLITLAYRGAMVSFLTIPLFQPPINNLRDLARSDLRIGGWGPELQKLFVQLNTDVGDEKARVDLINRYEVSSRFHSRDTLDF